jgi:hypothetical protein
MKKNFGIFLAIALGLSALLLTIAFQAGWVKANPFKQERAGAPTMVSYQGQIWDGDTPYNDTGYFRFAIYDSTLSLAWSNDGNDPPTTAVPLDVVNGLFSVNLGDTKLTGMTEPLGAKVFDDPSTTLTVWFSPTGSPPWTTMPEQSIAAVPYALKAQEAAVASSLEGYSAGQFQLYVSGSCPVGQAIRDINANGTVICEPVESKPVHSITTVDSLNDVGSFNSITIGTDGMGLIGYYDGTNGDVKVAHCNNIACTDFSTSLIDDSGGWSVGYGLSIAIAGDGLGVISYYDGDRGYLKLAHCNDVACGSANVQTIYTGLGGVTAPGTSITINTSGYPLISFRSATASAFMIVRCGNYTCSTQSLSSIEVEGNSGHNSSLTLSGVTYAVAAYINMVPWDLRVGYLSLANPDTKGVSIVDNTATMSSPSIIKGADGLPIISYSNLTSGLIKVAHCSDYTCSASTKTSLNFSFPPGGTSIAIGSDALPVISYVNSVGNLVVLKCSTVDCTGNVDFSVLDGSLGDAVRTSITIGMDGFPLISYYDRTNGNLMVAHCSNHACIPYLRGR